jgi:DNA-binding transcriptional LysR family regulator
MIDLERLRIFHTVARHKSITAAANHLGITQPAVSRQISILESQLKISLFHRHTRGLILTEQGDVLFNVVKRVFSRLILSEALMSEDNQDQGHLKVICSHSFGAFWLTPKIHEFRQIHPLIHVSLTLRPENIPVDLSIREADVMIGTQAPDDPSLISIPFMATQAKIYGSKTYFNDHPTPSSFQDLDQHKLITLSHDPTLPANWLLTAGASQEKPRKPFFTLNNSFGVLQAVSSAVGIGSFHFLDEQSKEDLVEVLPDAKLYRPTVTRFMIYHEKMKNSHRIDALRKFLFKKIVES